MDCFEKLWADSLRWINPKQIAELFPSFSGRFWIICNTIKYQKSMTSSEISRVRPHNSDHSHPISVASPNCLENHIAWNSGEIHLLLTLKLYRFEFVITKLRPCPIWYLLNFLTLADIIMISVGSIAKRLRLILDHYQRWWTAISLIQYRLLLRCAFTYN